MNSRISSKFKLMRAAFFVAIALSAIVVLPIFVVDVGNAEFKPTGSTEVNWQEATMICHSHGTEWSLPSLYQLAALYYRQNEIVLVNGTDYWSHNSFAGFAFGLNTGRGIASFDRHADTDHYLCVKQ